MAEASITLSFAKSRFLYGESCPVAATVDNTGARPLLLWDQAPIAPLTYSLRSEGEADPRYVLSERAWMESRARGILKEGPPEKALYLQPGKNRRFKADLAELGQEPFLPGRYSVTASMPGNEGTLVSAPAAIEAVPAAIELLARSVSKPREKASTVFVHREADGTRGIYHQLSASGTLQHSVYHKAAQAGAVSSIATSTDAMDLQAGRRIAWFEGPVLRSLEIWDDRVTKPLSTCPEELPGGVVVNPGIQFADGSACFMVARGAALSLYRIRGAQWTREGSAALGAEAPNALRLVWESQGERLRFLWAAASRLWSRRFTLALQPVEPQPVAVTEGQSPPAAWSVDTALYGSAESGFTARIGSRSVTLPPTPPGFRAAAIAPANANPPVAVQCGDTLQVWAAGSSEWREAATGVGVARHLEIFSVDGRRHFAQWIEPNSGVRFVLLPKA